MFWGPADQLEAIQEHPDAFMRLLQEAPLVKATG